VIDYETLTNPPEEGTVARIQFETMIFRLNYGMRHDRDPNWQRLHRHLAMKAIGTLRYLTNRPRKGEQQS
jgi:hypothetical protein